MPLSQALFDQLGAQLATQVHGSLMEQVTYTAQATPGTPHTVACRFRDFRASELTTGEIARMDRACWLQTALVTWTVRQGDTLTRADNTVWQVLSWTGGPGSVAYVLQCRQVG